MLSLSPESGPKVHVSAAVATVTGSGLPRPSSRDETPLAALPHSGPPPPTTFGIPLSFHPSTLAPALVTVLSGGGRRPPCTPSGEPGLMLPFVDANTSDALGVTTPLSDALGVFKGGMSDPVLIDFLDAARWARPCGLCLSMARSMTSWKSRSFARTRSLRVRSCCKSSPPPRISCRCSWVRPSPSRLAGGPAQPLPTRLSACSLVSSNPGVSSGGTLFQS
mmetsp:Transcript_28917/g.75857  ORF Transcript_28917/g.75857 Transcript_28917/m.75857 type:complete len:221 (+) Transcript_28917:442-1104(+)